MSSLIMRIYFSHHYKLLHSLNINRKRYAASSPHGRMAPFYCQFDILWIVIAAPNDDHVFEATGNKQHVFLEETHVSSAQERTFPCICQICPERILSLLRFVPIALSNAGASYPDFP